MLSKTAKFLLILSFSVNFFFLSEVQAVPLAEKGTWERKLQRGFLNVIFSPLEISHALAEETKKQEEWFNWLRGAGVGSWFAVIRAATGIYDILTAPFPMPKNYKPTMQPEFSLEYLGLFREKL